MKQAFGLKSSHSKGRGGSRRQRDLTDDIIQRKGISHCLVRWYIAFAKGWFKGCFASVLSVDSCSSGFSVHEVRGMTSEI